MFTAFFESFRYVGYFYPIAILRIFIGYRFLQSGLDRLSGDYLIQPRLAAEVSQWLPQSAAPVWYKNLLSDYMVQNWQVFSYIIMYCEFLVGLSFIFGFIVRPSALVGFLLCANILFISSPSTSELYQLYMFAILILFWLGAGRCMGFDYFFFKRQRGLWW
jgi:thiosulfate dehydrogenase [quinone] large subunit